VVMGLGANPFESPAVRDSPHPFYAMGRQMQPLFFMEGPGIWNAFLYEDCRAILRDPKRFSSEVQRSIPAELQRSKPSMLNTDPPRHTQLRELVNKAFTPRMIARLEPRIRKITDELLDAVAQTGSIELIDDLATPLPVIVIAEILGIPPADRVRFKHWSGAIVATLGTGLSAGPQDIPMGMINELRAYFTEIIDRRRTEPREDLISALLAAEIDGEKLSLDDLLSFCILLLVAGNETTTNLIGNGVRCLLEFPDQLERLRENPALWPAAVEEILRYRSPVQATVRLAMEDVKLRGKTIRSNQAVVVWLASANRDPAEFPDPDRFDAGRQPNRHLAFGLGIHFCLGAPLARREAVIALPEILRRLPDLRLTGTEALEPIPGFIMHGVKHLPLAFTPAAVPA
jgi:cytochrome P450